MIGALGRPKKSYVEKPLHPWAKIDNARIYMVENFPEMAPTCNPGAEKELIG